MAVFQKEEGLGIDGVALRRVLVVSIACQGTVRRRSDRTRG